MNEKAPPGAGTPERGGSIREQPRNDTTRARVLQFRPARRWCTNCGTHFQPRHAWHAHCLTCWRWLVVGLALRRSQRALAELRR